MLSEHLPKGIPYRKFEPLLLSDDCVSYPSILLVSYTTVLLVYEHVHRFFFFPRASKVLSFGGKAGRTLFECCTQLSVLSSLMGSHNHSRGWKSETEDILVYLNG